MLSAAQEVDRTEDLDVSGALSKAEYFALLETLPEFYTADSAESEITKVDFCIKLHAYADSNLHLRRTCYKVFALFGCGAGHWALEGDSLRHFTACIKFEGKFDRVQDKDVKDLMTELGVPGRDAKLASEVFVDSVVKKYYGADKVAFPEVYLEMDCQGVTLKNIRAYCLANVMSHEVKVAKLDDVANQQVANALADILPKGHAENGPMIEIASMMKDLRMEYTTKECAARRPADLASRMKMLSDDVYKKKMLADARAKSEDLKKDEDEPDSGAEVEAPPRFQHATEATMTEVLMVKKSTYMLFKEKAIDWYEDIENPLWSEKLEHLESQFGTGVASRLRLPSFLLKRRPKWEGCSMLTPLYNG